MDTSVKIRVVSLPNKKMLVAIQFPEALEKDGWDAAVQRVWDEIQVKRGRIGIRPIGPSAATPVPIASLGAKKGKGK